MYLWFTLHCYTVPVPVPAFRSRTKGCNIIQQCWIQICSMMLTLVAKRILHLETRLFQHCWIKFVERVWPPRWMTVNVVQFTMFVARACVQHCCTCRQTKKCLMTNNFRLPHFNIVHHHLTSLYMLAKHMTMLNSKVLHVVKWKRSIGLSVASWILLLSKIFLCSFLAACNIFCERKLN